MRRGVAAADAVAVVPTAGRDGGRGWGRATGRGRCSAARWAEGPVGAVCSVQGRI